jgi:hypothetical protein
MIVSTSTMELMMLTGRVYLRPLRNTLFFYVNLMSLLLTLSVVLFELGYREDAMVW